MIPAGWPAPLALMVALMREQGGEQGGEQEGETAGEGRAGPGAGTATLARGLDADGWESFADLTNGRHRVAPRVLPALKRLAAEVPGTVPARVRGRIEEAAHRNALITLVQISETKRIRTALAGAGVELAVFKGWPLAERLHGSAAARHAGDLDLLVPEDRVAESRLALEGIGFEVSDYTPKFRRRVRGLDNPQLIRACKDIEMIRPATGVTVELHWRMLNYHGWPVFLDRPGALAVQQTQAGPILTPDDATNLMYLSTHGALHLWDRLKWLDDIAVLARARGAGGLAADLGVARETGVARPVAFALGLAARLLGSPLPEGLEAAPAGTGRLDPRPARPPGRAASRRCATRPASAGWGSGWRAAGARRSASPATTRSGGCGSCRWT